MKADPESHMRTLADYLAVLTHWLWLLALGAILAALSAYVVSTAQQPIYRAEAVLVVNQSGTAQDVYNSVVANAQLAPTYASLVTEPIVLENAAQQVGGISAAALARKVHASADAGAPVVRIQADDSSPARAAALANAVAAALDTILIERGMGSYSAAGPVQVFQPAVPPTAPEQPRPLLSAAAAAALGLVLAGSMVLLLEVVDDRIRRPGQVEPAVGAPLIGNVAAQPVDELLFPTPGDSTLAASFRVLRRNLAFIGCERPLRVIAVTSARRGEGKTMVAINLARILAEGGERVVLVDANFRHPSIHTALGLPNHCGLSLLLRDFPTIDAYPCQHGSVLAAVPDLPSLSVITAGPTPPNPAELLSSSRMDQLLRAILAGGLGQGHTDVVVLDTPPVTLYPETAALARRVDVVDSILLVVDQTRSRQRALTRTRAHLAGAESKIIGAVFNRSASRRRSEQQPPDQEHEASAYAERAIFPQRQAEPQEISSSPVG